MALPTYGSMAVDWEQRVDFDRLRWELPAREGELISVGHIITSIPRAKLDANK